MQTLPTSALTSEDLDEIQAFAKSDVSSSVRDLLLSLVASIREDEDIIAVGEDGSVTPNQAAKKLGMSRTHLYKLLDRGDIDFYSVGRVRRIRMRDLLEFEKQRDSDRRDLAERFARQSETSAGADEEIARLL
ncbi:Helix-turn-helix domain protein [Corynebacterium atrinae]|uniref:helix-turn-helix domain-containing protein n=1 Tax=Corynebacterium atrinae TaxID=1336740 RepID=UPI0025B3C990|nr:helix-turn-helix domain-containing protein [Corynebacterium atrinae]WJY62612.1 Helix-turn-helix domain protein [Corynebacterium atrinae]